MFGGCFTGVDGNTSMKRVAGGISLAMLALCTVAEAIGHPIHDHALDIWASMFGTCVIGATVDHFTAHQECQRDDGGK